MSTHPLFGTLPHCAACGGHDWEFEAVERGRIRDVAIARCTDCGAVGLVDDAVRTKATEFGGAFDV